MTLPEVTEIDGGVLLPVRVSTRASSNAINGVHEGRLKISVTTVPEKGKANKAVFKLLSKLFGVPASAMEIRSGDKSRNKNVVIGGLSGKEAMECLKKATPTR